MILTGKTPVRPILDKSILECGAMLCANHRLAKGKRQATRNNQSGANKIKPPLINLKQHQV